LDENCDIIKGLMPAKKPSKINYGKIAAISSLGLMLPSSIAVGLFLGYYLDKFFGTHPWLLLVFFILGVVSGFYSLLRGLSKFKDE
jgi:ATP synthase protein I